MQKPKARRPEIEPARVLTVLVVDDSRLQRRLLTGNLDKWGYEVFEAESGHGALEICKATQVDLILSDWMMPGMDGLEFCRQFRALEQDNYGYFILLTSKDDKAEVVAGLDVGADDLLTKPVHSSELRARLRSGERILAMQKEMVEKNKAISVNLKALQNIYAAIDRDLEEAKKLQHSLVPETFLEIGRAEISLKLQSSGHIGGDMIGHYFKSPERIGVFGFDVSGHGISAALMTARLAGCLGAASPAYNIAMEPQPDGSFALHSPSEIARRMNRRMIDEMDTDLYLTILLAEIDLVTGKLTLAQAGHPHPLIIRKSGALEFIGGGGMPVGLIADADFDSCEANLEPGDRFLIYSDGFTEAENSQGVMLDEDGFGALITAHARSSGPELLDDLVWEIQAYSGGDEVGDDLSAVLVELTQ
ncbi:MAG: fused response regulator/phosphatase [Alphaproteobacteria bacterium]|nr:fused response regulator/phosphatase [Alphaproteobacteria bacterium]